jgi:hypothetical protein
VAAADLVLARIGYSRQPCAAEQLQCDKSSEFQADSQMDGLRAMLVAGRALKDERCPPVRQPIQEHEFELTMK